MNVSIKSTTKNEHPQINICMGSACHQMGIFQVLPKLERLINNSPIANQIDLRGSFCLGNCKEGIVIQSDSHLVKGINPQNIEAKFVEEILPAVILEITNHQ